MVEPTLFKKAIDAEPINLAKLGWSECRDDKHIFSYIRGYIWRNYKIRIKPPLDFIILCMLDDALQKLQDEDKDDLSCDDRRKNDGY